MLRRVTGVLGRGVVRALSGKAEAEKAEYLKRHVDELNKCVVQNATQHAAHAKIQAVNFSSNPAFAKAAVELNAEAVAAKTLSDLKITLMHIRDKDLQTQVLDVGCYTGNLGALLREQGLPNVLSMESDPAVFAEGVKRGYLRANQDYCTTIMGLPHFLNGSFDLLTCFFTDPARAVRTLQDCEIARMAQLLKPGGSVLIGVDQRPGTEQKEKVMIKALEKHFGAALPTTWTCPMAYRQVAAYRPYLHCEPDGEKKSRYNCIDM